MRILVVEDEPTLCRQLQTLLEQHGYAVDTASDGREALFQGQETPFDLAVVDLGLPQLSGVDVIHRWREAGRDFPILILTARGRWQEKVEGLEAGADDYMVKPFHDEELLARVRALLRRAHGQSRPVIRSGPISLDLRTRTLSVNNQPQELTAYEYRVAEYLILNPDKVVSKTELTEHIYDQDFDRDSNVIEVFIGRLRKKLDNDGTLKPIETLRGRGYRWTLATREGEAS
ncbi:response regulator transcription factor [Thiohalophilus sp.]|uniref:response regulator transcription factor n=1 Tax=Thiohalophilus sp. TaxID=3028392 RepID=UPI002ACDB3EE|nr:response regulator transcription factor [Thiohalophilus sp.]MDZ7804890.1 response regulator transcription factor [Thiohalophilus sp.]